MAAAPTPATPGRSQVDSLVLRVDRTQRVVGLVLNGHPLATPGQVLRWPNGDGTQVVQITLRRCTVEDEHNRPPPWPWLQAFMAKLRGA